VPRSFRRYLLGCVAITFAYLLWHAFEPLRLDIGDPWSDAELVSSHDVLAASPLSSIVYAAIAKLGVSDVSVFRLFALVFSALGTVALFQYLRRMWSESVAWIGTTLFATSLLSIMHADGLQSPPLAHAGCFIALWGLVRAIESNQVRHFLAAGLGSFVCTFAASDDWLFLSAGALCTIAGKRGDPLARGNFRFVVVCAAGGIAGALANAQFVLEAKDLPTSLDLALKSQLLPLLTLVLTPTLWITALCATWHALRAPSLRALLDDAMNWLVVVAIILVAVLPPRPGPPMLRVISVLPFFATGSALLIDRLLHGNRLWRASGIAWMVVAPAWAFAITLSHPRAVLDRGDVASVRAYLASNDRNDFVLTNLLSEGVVHGAFDRTNWSPIAEYEDWSTTTGHDEETADGARVRLLEAFEAAGTDTIHAVIFTTPESRFVDRSLEQLAKYRGLPSATAWPYLRRGRANELIRAYDAEVRQLLDASGAQRVLHFETFDVYRIDRHTVLEHAGQSIQVVRKLDLSRASNRHLLLGWRGPRLSELRGLGVVSIVGYAACSDPQVVCETAPSESGLRVPDARLVDRAQLMIRVDRACDLEMTVELGPAMSPLWFLAGFTDPVLGVSVGGFTASQCASSDRMSFVIPKRFVQDGLNLVTFTSHALGPLNPGADLRSLELEPRCE
jgi:hypothetical protein